MQVCKIDVLFVLWSPEIIDMKQNMGRSIERPNPLVKLTIGTMK